MGLQDASTGSIDGVETDDSTGLITDDEIVPSRPRPGALDSDSAADSALSMDDVFHILQTKRRRDVLRYVIDESGPVRLRDLAEYVAANEHGKAVDELTSSERQRVYISLYQSHLPKLDEHGVVTYDKDRGIVEATSMIDRFEPYLDGQMANAGSSTDRWPVRYGFVALGSGLLLSGTAVGLVPLPELVGALAILLGFVGVVIAHAYDRSRRSP